MSKELELLVEEHSKQFEKDHPNFTSVARLIGAVDLRTAPAEFGAIVAEMSGWAIHFATEEAGRVGNTEFLHVVNALATERDNPLLWAKTISSINAQ